MEIIDKICVENAYSGSDWNFEKTTKYVLRMDDKLLEAGYFEHYRDDILVKVVLELPTSYGCPVKCKFCASAAIDSIVVLTDGELRELFEYLYTEHALAKQEYVLLSLTGIGDFFFNVENLRCFLLGLKSYGNLHVTLSSCLWNAHLLEIVRELGKDVFLRNVQMTYVSDRKNVLAQVIPFYERYESCLDEVLQYIATHTECYYRFNYIMMKNINDSAEDFARFCKCIEPVKDKVVVRLSMLNETGATRKNHLEPVAREVLESFKNILSDNGIRAYMFYAEANDDMNCGQLITERRGKISVHMYKCEMSGSKCADRIYF